MAKNKQISQLREQTKAESIKDTEMASSKDQEIEQLRKLMKSKDANISEKDKIIETLKKEIMQIKEREVQQINKSNDCEMLKEQLLASRQEIDGLRQTIQIKDAEIVSKDKMLDTLKNEITAMKELQIDQSEQKQNDDGNLKEDLASIIDKLNAFNNKYDMDVIDNIYYDNPNELSVESDIGNAGLSAKCMIKKLQDIEQFITERNKPDATQYKSWDINMTMKWIKSLNYGQFVKHLDVLRKGFESDGIVAADLPDIGQHDLSTQPFEIRSFGDRKKLAQHFRSLRDTQSGMDVNDNEGQETQYHQKHG